MRALPSSQGRTMSVATSRAPVVVCVVHWLEGRSQRRAGAAKIDVYTLYMQIEHTSDDEPDWMQAHRALTRLARERAAADAEEARWLLTAWRSAAHVHLGFGSFCEYTERLLGYKPRTTRDKLRVAEALEALPLTAS